MLKKSGILLLGFAFLAVAISVGQSAASSNREINRGKYLVNNVAQCGDCHSPRLPTGAPDKEHWLQGSTLGFAPLHPMPKWANQAPGIAGLPSLKPEDIVTLLQTGAMPDGTRPNPPMPTFHMHPADARAVVAYLQSLSAAKK